MSNYIEKIKSMIWSHSRVMAYVSCPYMFYLKYILEDEGQYIAEGNYYAEAGSYVHEILEKIFNNELSVDDASQYYVDNYDDNIFYKVKQSTMDNTFELCVDYLVNLNLDWLKDYKILGVEKELEINLEGYKFTGFIDLLLEHKDTGEIHVVDHKSSAYPFKKDGKSLLKKAEKDFDKYKKQMYLYSKYVFDEYGKFPSTIAWNHFKDQKIAKIPFNKDDYENALKWYIDTIHIIENDENFSENKEFFYCKNLCDFRSSCEYNVQD